MSCPLHETRVTRKGKCRRLQENPTAGLPGTGAPRELFPARAPVCRPLSLPSGLVCAAATPCQQASWPLSAPSERELGKVGLERSGSGPWRVSSSEGPGRGGGVPPPHLAAPRPARGDPLGSTPARCWPSAPLPRGRRRRHTASRASCGCSLGLQGHCCSPHGLQSCDLGAPHSLRPQRVGAGPGRERGALGHPRSPTPPAAGPAGAGSPLCRRGAPPGRGPGPPRPAPPPRPVPQSPGPAAPPRPPRPPHPPPACGCQGCAAASAPGRSGCCRCPWRARRRPDARAGPAPGRGLARERGPGRGRIRGRGAGESECRRGGSRPYRDAAAGAASPPPPPAPRPRPRPGDPASPRGDPSPAGAAL